MRFRGRVTALFVVLAAASSLVATATAADNSTPGTAKGPIDGSDIHATLFAAVDQDWYVAYAARDGVLTLGGSSTARCNADSLMHVTVYDADSLGPPLTGAVLFGGGPYPVTNASKMHLLTGHRYIFNVYESEGCEGLGYSISFAPASLFTSTLKPTAPCSAARGVGSGIRKLLARARRNAARSGPADVRADARRQVSEFTVQLSDARSATATACARVDLASIQPGG
jgi:hypothetical protein